MSCSRTRTTTEVQRPTVGRIVHYVSHGTPEREDGTRAYASQCRAAVVTEVPEHLPAWAEPFDGCDNGYQGVWCVSLAVLNPTGMFFDQDVRYEPSGAAGTWHWPERA
ncbi:hypothetical protein ACFW34_35170 [Streptomyces sp. NPDC058848]|uniref:hypothetical protein n=1 Tax=Streptomyces sp. NPDC058848 TaxID=3346650 RepID=UPI0036C3843F